MIEGIDVSKYQGKIDWQKVVDGGLVQFAVAKATERKGVDPRFKDNWDGIKKVGLLRGAYHFARTNRTFVEEAEHFLKSIGSVEAEDVLVLDIEESTIKNLEFTTWVLGWLEYVEKKSGKIPFIYTYGPFWETHVGKPSLEVVAKFQEYPLWLAAYTKDPEKFVPKIWKKLGWTLWQKSGNIAAPGEPLLFVPGITGVVDRNIFRGTLPELKKIVLNLHGPIDGGLGDALTSITDPSKEPNS